MYWKRTHKTHAEGICLPFTAGLRVSPPFVCRHQHTFLFTDKTGETNPIGNIFAHKMGNATVMVEAAINFSTSLSPRDSSASEQQEQSSHRYEKFVKKYSDRLLVNATDERKSSSHARRPRGRRAREALKNKDAKEEDLNWVGPAVWDIRIGGDGHPKFLCDVMVRYSTINLPFLVHAGPRGKV